MPEHLLVAAVPPRNKKPVMLVVDDQPLNIRLIRELFHEEFDVFMATDGLKAVNKVQQILPDIILLDVVMPNIDGFEVCRILKRDPAISAIPVIFITGNINEEDEVTGFEVGGADFIRKPINPVITRARVNTQLALKQQADKLRRIALTDGLTGVANRRSFDSELASLWHQSLRYQSPLSLIMFDVDYFKNYNDHYGHQAGDVCLQKIGQAIQQTLNRSQDFVARYGGEEFACVLQATDAEGARHLAGLLSKAIESLQIEHVKSEVADIVTVSIGIVTQTVNEGLTVEGFIELADQQLYRAKAQGRARICSADLIDEEAG